MLKGLYSSENRRSGQAASNSATHPGTMPGTLFGVEYWTDPDATAGRYCRMVSPGDPKVERFELS